MPASNVSHLEVLLRQSGWARSLARRLVEDASEADDLVQEAFVIALERAPSRGVPLRGWLASVLRNLARARWRARVRRELRERASARLEEVGPGHELLDRFEQQRVLAEEVSLLEEPFRSALLMRYFDGLPPEEIAARTAENVRTVHSRLHRGLARLRERLLRRTGGDARAWMAALFPFGFGRGGIAGPLLGGWIVNTHAKVAAAVVAVGALAVTVTYWPITPSPVAPESTPAIVSTPIGDELEPDVVEETGVDERAEIVSVNPGEPPAVEEQPGVTAGMTVSGRVVDIEGLPLAGLEIGVRSVATGSEHPEPRALSLADGSFVLRGPAISGRVTVISRAWIALFEASAPQASQNEDGTELLLIAARAISISGTVVDEQRAPIPDAELEYLIPADLRTRFPGLLDAALPIQSSSRSDAQGFFQMPRLPGAAGGNLRARSAGFEEALVDLPEGSRDDLVVVLRSKQDVAFLPGTVVDATGQAVEGAVVVLGNASTRSDASGKFLLSLEHPGEGRVLQAVKRGFLPARLECGPGEGYRVADWPDPLVLRLGETPLSIAGVVVDAGGHPVARAQVSIVDRTYLGLIEARFGTEIFEAPQWIETELNGGYQFTGFVSTDEDGRFRLEGLLARAYAVQAFDPRSLSHGHVSSVEAGREDVEIRLPCEAGVPTIRGRVVARSGAPVEGALVLPVRRIRPPVSSGEQPYGETEVSGEGPTTDEQGRFELRALCSEPFALRAIHGSSLGVATVELAALASLDDVEIVLSLQCHLQVDLESSSIEANNVRLLDAQGEELSLVVYHGEVSFASHGFAFEGRKSEAFVVPEDAATLVLLHDQVEVARIPLFLRAGELNVIRP